MQSVGYLGCVSAKSWYNTGLNNYFSHLQEISLPLPKKNIQGIEMQLEGHHELVTGL